MVEAPGDLDAAEGAGDRRRVVGAGQLRPGDARDRLDAARTGGRVHHRRSAGQVEAAVVERAGGCHGVRPAEDEVGEGERVDADVEECAGAELGLPQPGHVAARGEPELRPHLADLADGAVGDESLGLADGRVRAHPHGLGEEEVARAGVLGELPAGGGVEGQGLLAEHRLAGVEAEQGVLEVPAVGAGHVDHVDVGVGGQRGVVAVGARVGRAVLGEERAGPLDVARPGGDDLVVGQQREVAGEAARDASGGEDPPAQGAVGGQGRGHAAGLPGPIAPSE